MELLNWLEMWYTSVCNGEWEEYYGIKIVTIDNPGWLVEIDISETELEGKNFPPFQVEKGENDWISCKVEDDKFIGAGDKTKLCDIIEVFKTWSEVK